MMSSYILEKLEELKKLGISVSTIEKELKFSNGLLGKAAKGKTYLSEEKQDAFVSYWSIKTGRSRLLEGSMTDPNTEAGKFAQKVVEDLKEKYKDGGTMDQILSSQLLSTPKKKIEDLKDSIKNLKPAIETSKIAPISFQLVSTIKEPNWVSLVMDYCSLETITPLELIEQHKSFKKQLNKQKPAQISPDEAKKQHSGSSWFSNYASRKSQGSKIEKP